MTKKRYKTVTRNYGSRFSALEEGPSDVVGQEDLSSGAAVKAPTFIEQGDYGLLKRALSFGMEFPDI